MNGTDAATRPTAPGELRTTLDKQRAAFLRDTCADDEALRRFLVARLALAAMESAAEPLADGLRRAGLAQRGDALALEVVERGPPAELPPTSVAERITKALTDAGQAVPLAQLRAACRVRNATLCERLSALTGAGRLVRDADGYQLPAG